MRSSVPLMSERLRVLVLPGTSESGIEVQSSLRFTRGVQVWSGSVHPQFAQALGYAGSVFIPNVSSDAFLSSLSSVCRESLIDVVVPAHDDVAHLLRGQSSIGATRVVSHPADFVETVRSKRRTYERLKGSVPTPRVFLPDEVTASSFPLFAKPDTGQGSRGTQVIASPEDLSLFVQRLRVASVGGADEYVFSEFLGGNEITVDCFSDSASRLIFAGARDRGVVRAGISVHTSPSGSDEVIDLVERIGEVLRPAGPWFAQFKFHDETPVLLEVGPRVAGSSGLWRLNGVNLSEMALHQALGRSVAAPEWSPRSGSVRRLSLEPSIGARPSAIVLDFDDVLVINRRTNGYAVALAATARSFGIPTSVVSRHDGDLMAALGEIRASDLFDSIVHIRDAATKANHVPDGAWFFDDSFSERQSVVAEVPSVRALDPSTIPAMTAALCELFISESHSGCP